MDLRTSIAGEGAADVAQRAKGEFLRKLVVEIQPMLHEAMRSRRIVVGSDWDGVIALKSDGGFIHVGIGDQEDTWQPFEVMRAEPNLVSILDRIEVDLVAADDPRAAFAAEVVRAARQSLLSRTSRERRAKRAPGREQALSPRRLAARWGLGGGLRVRAIVRTAIRTGPPAGDGQAVRSIDDVQIILGARDSKLVVELSSGRTTVAQRLRDVERFGARFRSPF